MAHIKACNEEEFSVAHFTGKVTYNASAMVSKNRDFLPPEITDVMRFSKEDIIKQIFTNKLSKTGNVTLLVDKTSTISEDVGKKRWGTALLADSKRNIRVCGPTHYVYLCPSVVCIIIGKKVYLNHCSV